MLKKILKFTTVFALCLMLATSVVAAPTSANLEFLERFNGNLDGWTLDETGGTVAIQARDDVTYFSNLLELDDTSGSDLVSAIETFTEPSATTWILEFDIYYPASSIITAQLLDSGDNVIADMVFGNTANQVDFDTDNASASSQAFTDDTWKQAMFVVDNVNDDISAYISEDDDTYGSLKTRIGSAAKSYTGATIAKIKFVTDSTATGTNYINEVKAYESDYFMIGDSVIDGKSYWSTHPAYPTGRLTAKEDETSSPAYQLGLLLGSSSTTWVANRAFGGSRTDDIDDYIAQAVIEHNPVNVIIGNGHNDIANAVTLTTMQTEFESVFTQLLATDISTRRIHIMNVFPGNDLQATAELQKIDDWNDWLRVKTREFNGTYVDLNDRLKDPAKTRSILATYDDTDAVHLVPAGSAQLADKIYDDITAAEAVTYTEVITMGEIVGTDVRMYPQGDIVPTSGRRHVIVIN